MKNNHRLVLLLHRNFQRRIFFSVHSVHYSIVFLRRMVTTQSFSFAEGHNTDFFQCRIDTIRSSSNADFLAHHLFLLQENLNTTVLLDRCRTTQLFINTGYHVHTFLKARDVKTYTKTEFSTKINMHSMICSHTIQFN